MPTVGLGVSITVTCHVCGSDLSVVSAGQTRRYGNTTLAVRPCKRCINAQKELRAAKSDPEDVPDAVEAKDGELVPVSDEFVKAGRPMPVEIKPGYELDRLDRAVAEAIGWKHLDDEQHEGIPPMGAHKYLPIPNYSTDLNAAFAAAETAVQGAWDEDQRGWEMSPYVGCTGRGWTCNLGCDEHRAFADTPALAICAAILELKKKDE